MKVTSRDNSLLRRARAVRDGRDDDSIYIEGLRLCEEALASKLKIETVIYSEELARKKRAALLLEKMGKPSTKMAAVSEKLLASISFTKTPQGIVVLAKHRANDKKNFTAKQPAAPFLIIMHSISNPVNVGAILRTSEAAGVTGVITTMNTSNPFSPKALRGAMGSAFRLPIWMGASYEETTGWCDKRGIRTICADAQGSKSYTEVDWGAPRALVVGPESTGFSASEIALANEAVRIPMRGSVESLNVAVAAGILLYEAARQQGRN